MKKVLSVLALALLVGAGSVAATTDASAQHRRHHHRGPGIGPALGGLAVGAIIGGAIASSQRPAYAYPPGYVAPGYAPPPAYYDEPVCHVEPQQYWDGFSWRVRNVRVCD